MNPFEFINSINNTKVNLMDQDEEAETKYNSFLTNRSPLPSQPNSPP